MDDETMPALVKELLLDVQAFRENNVYTQDGDPIRLGANADRIEQAAAAITALREELASAQAENVKLQAHCEVMAGTVEHFRSYGCPVCNGDCASANPPVNHCPMRDAHQALAAYRKEYPNHD